MNRITPHVLLALVVACGAAQAAQSTPLEPMTAPSPSRLLLSPALTATPGANSTVKDVTEGDTLFFRISATEPTRLSIEGGRIAALNYIQEDLDVQQDNTLGQAYLRPRTADKAITLYVTTSANTTATLTLQPSPGPATSIRLRDIKQMQASVAPRVNQSVPTVASDYTKAVESLITVAAKGIDVSGVDVVQVNQPVQLWEGVSFLLQRRHTAQNMVVETYALRNLSQAPLRVAEQEFFTTSVAGVAVELHEILPGESTAVYVARWIRE